MATAHSAAPSPGRNITSIPLRPSSQLDSKRATAKGEKRMSFAKARLFAIVLVAGLLSTAAIGQQPFVDAEKDHWAFEAMDNLQKKGILVGYPDGHFRGKRTMTRYEFAVALDRALKSLPVSATGQAGPAGPAGPQGPAGEPG